MSYKIGQKFSQGHGLNLKKNFIKNHNNIISSRDIIWIKHTLVDFGLCKVGSGTSIRKIKNAYAALSNPSHVTCTCIRTQLHWIQPFIHKHE